MPNVVLFQIICFGIYLFLFKVKFDYKDQNGKEVDFPFKFEEKVYNEKGTRRI